MLVYLVPFQPQKGTTSTGDGHTHPNLPLLNNLSIENNYLKVGSTPVETHLLSEEW